MMSKMFILGLTLIILLVPIFLISFGTTGDNPTLYWTGLIMLGAGGVIPPVTRFAFDNEE